MSPENVPAAQRKHPDPADGPEEASLLLLITASQPPTSKVDTFVLFCVAGPDQLCDASFVSSDDDALLPAALERQVSRSDDHILSKMKAEACSAAVTHLLDDLYHKVLSGLS